MRTLVCLPTYNEEENIQFMVEGILSTGLELVVCDGHSTDRTVEIARSMEQTVLMRDGFGKGAAILVAVRYALENGFDRLMTIDCDRTYDYHDIPLLIKEAGQFDMVVGARDMSDITFLRRMANYLMTFVLNLLFGSNIRDMATGFRVFDPIKFAPYLNASSFDIEPQIYAVALREGFTIREIPISYSKRVGSSKVRLRHLFLIIARMVRERFK